jgi:hypothetical protein
MNKLILREIINCIKSAPQRQGNYVFIMGENQHIYVCRREIFITVIKRIEKIER